MNVVVKARENGDGYDIAFLGANVEQAVALRNAFSDVDENRAYAQRYGKSLMPAIRSNVLMRSIHEDFKRNVRDVKPNDIIEVEESSEFDPADGWV